MRFLCLASAVLGVVSPVDERSLETLVNEAPAVVLNFYSPTCPHCQAFDPILEKVSELFEGQGVRFAKVDGEADGELADLYDIARYPTMLMFRNQMIHEYEGALTEESASDWISRFMAPAILKVDSEASITDRTPPTFIAFVPEDSPRLQMITILAEADRTLGHYYYVPSTQDRMHVIPTDGEAFDINLGTLNQDEDEFTEELHELLLDSYFPLFGPINEQTVNRYQYRTKEYGVWFIGTKDDYAKHYDLMRELAIRTKPKTSVVWLDVEDHAESSVALFGDVTPPGVALMTEEAVEIYKGSLNIDDLVAFCNKGVQQVHDEL